MLFVGIQRLGLIGTGKIKNSVGTRIPDRNSVFLGTDQYFDVNAFKTEKKGPKITFDF
jgi:hypothetical protein